MNGMMMVEMAPGYGDGYAVVEYRDGKPVMLPADSPSNTYRRPAGIALEDKGVRVAVAPIMRVVGPADGAAAARVRAERYTKNWGEKGFVAKATGDELLAAMSHSDEHETYESMTALRRKYAAE